MILSPSALNSIRRAVGPSLSDGVVDILRSENVKTDYGVKPGALSTVWSNIAARFTHLGSYGMAGTPVQGLMRVDADVMISLDAIADVRPHDVLTKKAQAWSASTFYADGQEVISDPWNNYIYVCIVAGTTNSSAPTWPTAQGNTVTDGSVTWRCEGLCTQFTVTELVSPRTYGDYISKQVYAKFRQDA